MKNLIRILSVLALLSLAGCYSYNDVKLNVLDAETKAPMGNTYIVLNDTRGMNPFRRIYQKLYKTDDKGELIIDRGGSFFIEAVSVGYTSSREHANTYIHSDPTKGGFVPKTILMQKSEEKHKNIALEKHTISDYDYDPLTKEFIDYCLANKIKIYNRNSRTIFNLKDDR